MAVWKATISRKSLPPLVTVMPWFCTACGKRASACCSLFCTCICATSASVPAAKVRLILALPAELLLADMYNSPSSPFICCSTTWVTESSMVLAEAPV
ncbi:hypothetical protein D3C75_1113920 [compost metagenome]